MWQRWGREVKGEQMGEKGENSDARMMIGISAPSWPISMPLLLSLLLSSSSPSSLNADPFQSTHCILMHIVEQFV